MSNYYISETQNINSIREGELVKAKTLVEAKRLASKMQCFCGTVMKIESNNNLVAYKEDGKKWVNV